MVGGELQAWRGKRHEALSAAIASSLSCPEAVVFAILTHHKSLPGDGVTAHGPGCLPLEQLPWADDPTPVWQEMVSEWQRNKLALMPSLLALLKAVGVELREDVNLEPQALHLRRPWLSRGRGRSGQRRAIPFEDRLHASQVRGLTMAADHLGSAHLLPREIPNLKRFAVLARKARQFQRVAAKTEGSAILRAPTGSGKTEAALLWAQNNQRPNGRLFYVLPYTASINAMYLRLGPGRTPAEPGTFSSGNVGLLHSRATAALYALLEANGDLASRLDTQENSKTLSGLAREMWFPVRVCTPHQILRYMLRGKGWETMLVEFPNACLIFDEVHAYDPRVVGLTLGTARLLGRWGVRCLFVSATLPEFLARLIGDAVGEVKIIDPNPKYRSDREILDKKRHSLEIRDGTILDHLEGVIKAAVGGGSTLIVCNHVRTAQEVFRRVEVRLGTDVVLLHSRFHQEGRNRIERPLHGRSVPKVLVATQVIEVSLDLDFDRAFVEPAPVDALVQRMGRVNRAGDRTAPSSIVLFREQVNPFHLYCECRAGSHSAECRVRLSLEELARIGNPVSESDLAGAVNRVYAGGYIGDDRKSFEEGLNHRDIAGFEGSLLAGAHQEWVEQIIESTDGTVEVLPKSLVGEYQARRSRGLWIEAESLLVSIRVKSFMSIKGRVDTTTDPWVVDCEYSNRTGLEL